MREGACGRAGWNTGLGGMLRGCRIGTPGAGMCAVVLNQHNRCSSERWSRIGTIGPSLTIRPVVPQILVHPPGVSNQHPRTAFRGSGELPGPVVVNLNRRMPP